MLVCLFAWSFVCFVLFCLLGLDLLCYICIYTFKPSRSCLRQAGNNTSNAFQKIAHACASINCISEDSTCMHGVYMLVCLFGWLCVCFVLCALLVFWGYVYIYIYIYAYPSNACQKIAHALSSQCFSSLSFFEAFSVHLRITSLIKLKQA